MKVSPHRGFEEEVALLDSFFDDGRAYCLGSVSVFAAQTEHLCTEILF